MLVSRYVANQAYFGVDTDRIGCENTLLVLVLRCVVNRSCLGVDTDGIGCETTLPVLALRYVVIEVASELTLIKLVVKQLCHCLCLGMY